MAFYGLELGKKAMLGNQTALNVVGQNIANANTPGYSRQKVNLEAQYIYSEKYGTFGAGVELASVKRARNEFIDDRMIKETTEQAKWETREKNIENLQYVFNEPNDGTIRDSLDSFWTSLQDLANNAQESSTRETVKEKAEDLASVIKSAHSQVKSMQDEMNSTIKVEMEDVNSKLKQIADLNVQIAKVELDGVTSANELRDQRDSITEELSKSLDIKVNRSGSEFSIIIDGRAAVQGSTYQQFKMTTSAEEDNKYTIRWEDTEEKVSISNGKVKAMLELRDEDTIKYMDYLDELAIGVIDAMNEVHRSGFDINGQAGGQFFRDFEVKDEIIDPYNSGEYQAAIYKIYGDKSVTNIEGKSASTNSGITAQTGSFEINNIRISYNTSSDSIKDIIQRINDADTGVVAALDPNNRLVFRADKESGYTVRLINETSGTFLQEMGILNTGSTSFNYKNTATLSAISAERLATPKTGVAERMEVYIQDVDKIAAAKGKDTNGDGIADTTLGIGNGDNILAMAQVKGKSIIGNYTAGDYFKSLVSDLGVAGKQATTFYGNQKTLTTSLEQRRQSEIGVSLDEEITEMIKYQHGYNAAAKFISTVDSMIETLISGI